MQEKLFLLQDESDLALKSVYLEIQQCRSYNPVHYFISPQNVSKYLTLKFKREIPL